MTTETPVCVGSKQTLVFKLEVVLGCLQKTSVCYTIHCPKNSLNFRTKTKPVVIRAYAMASVWFLCQICKQKPDILCRDSDYFWDSVFHPIYYLVKIANELKLCYRLFCCILVQ